MSYRDRERVRALSSLYEKAIGIEVATGVPSGAAEIHDAMAWHTRQAEVAEARASDRSPSFLHDALRPF